MLQTRSCPQLDGVQETMLWTLHERAYEASRPNATFRDPESVRIYNSIDYDFAKSFGAPLGNASARAAKIDSILQKWLSHYPSGLVVSLGEGLETQAYRVDNGSMRWLSVDLPDAIEFRERFIKPTARFRHLAMSAFDLGWMDQIRDRSRVFIVAQGLLMYFEPETVRQLLVAISERLPGAEMAFDMLPRNSTNQSHRVTKTWTSPVMPWGLDRAEVTATLRSWMPGLRKISCSRYQAPGKRPAMIEGFLDRILPHRQKLPSLVHVRF